MPTRTEQMRDDLIRHQVRLLRALRGIEAKALPQLTDELELELETITTRARIGSERRVHGRIIKARRRATPKAGDVIASTRRAAEALLLDEALDLVVADQRAVARITAARLSVPVNPLKRGRLKTLLETMPVEGATISELLEKYDADVVEKYRRAVVQGAQLGETNAEIAARVVGTEGGAGGVIDSVTRRQAQALVDTSTQTYLNAARLEQFRDSSEVRAVQLSTTFDSKVCPQCAALAGVVVDKDTLQPLKESPIAVALPQPPPLHPRCRCTLLPVLVGEDAAEDLDFEKWLKAQDAATGREVLGATTYELWREGRIALADVIDQKGRPLKVSEIEADAA